MFKMMAMAGGAAFLVGICCGSIGWAAVLVVGGGTLAAIGGMYMDDEEVQA